MNGSSTVDAMIEVVAPSGRLVLGLGAVDGRLVWRIELGGAEVIADSALGLRCRDAEFVTGVAICDPGTDRQHTVVRDRPSGKQRRAVGTGTFRSVLIENEAGDRVALEVAVFDDAVAHRFRQLEPLGPTAPASGLRFPAGTAKFVQKYDRAGLTQPASEALYSGSVPIGHVLEDDTGWSLPVLFETPEAWVLVTETAVGAEVDGSRLHNDPGAAEHRFVPPLDDQHHGPIDDPPNHTHATAWKVAIVSDELGRIVAADVVELLAAPTSMDDTGWVRPGRVSWSWWSDSDSPRNPERLTEFVDFAAEMGWEYSLVDANWNLMPAGTIEGVVSHARSRGVGIFLWYNSGGPHNEVTEQPRGRMHQRERRRREMRWLSELGVAGLKVDFFHSDRASMNRLALEMLEDAAEHRLLMNFHGITSPKGWHATWPHLLTTEAVRGAEQYKFAPEFPETAAELNTVLAFTRNVVGPMDYTPVTVSDVDHPHLTTTAHELALGVVFESGLQHLADAPESYRALGAGALDYLARLPVAWDEVRLLAGRPAHHVVLARRRDDDWWIGGLNGTTSPVEVIVDLDELGSPHRLLVDGPSSRTFAVVDPVGGPQRVTMSARGGFVAWPARRSI